MNYGRRFPVSQLNVWIAQMYLPTVVPGNLIVAANLDSSESSGGFAINGLVGCVWSVKPRVSNSICLKKK